MVLRSVVPLVTVEPNSGIDCQAIGKPPRVLGVEAERALLSCGVQRKIVGQNLVGRDDTVNRLHLELVIPSRERRAVLDVGLRKERQVADLQRVFSAGQIRQTTRRLATIVIAHVARAHISHGAGHHASRLIERPRVTSHVHTRLIGVFIGLPIVAAEHIDHEVRTWCPKDFSLGGPKVIDEIVRGGEG